jgi:hypothetical protein
MFSEPMLFLTWPVFGLFIALPAAAAWRRRRVSREASDVATKLNEYAAAVRRASRCLPLDEALRARILRLNLGESAALLLSQERGGWDALADAAQRLALRLRRRVAFNRKMLARTAPGLRRGAIAAAAPPLLALSLQWAGAQIPPAAHVFLLLVEAAGCALLWRLARVEV